MEMGTFMGFLFDSSKGAFKFTYEEGGKKLLCDRLLSGTFQIVAAPGKTLFGAPAIVYQHLGMKKSFDGVKALTTKA
jgi:hypothetical protein